VTNTRVDRAALVRRAMVDLVADRGIHGTSMSMVAEQAGVATGTAYVHYDSKEKLLIAAFVEVKDDLGRAALEGVPQRDEPKRMFAMVWRNIYQYLTKNPAVARFLLQVEASPLRGPAHDALGVNALTETATTLKEDLVELPEELLYELGLAPAVRIAASGEDLSQVELDTVVESCWRAIRR
jgi:AcrR family transcriptional regulator